jgi:hypothetical protein
MWCHVILHQGLGTTFEWKLNTQYCSLGVKEFEYNYINFSYAKSIWVVQDDAKAQILQKLFKISLFIQNLC